MEGCKCGIIQVDYQIGKQYIVAIFLNTEVIV